MVAFAEFRPVNDPMSERRASALAKARSQLPLVVGVGGTTREGSNTEKALAFALQRAEALGAQTQLFGGTFLARLPAFNPHEPISTPEQQAFLAAMRVADGIVLASPGYHGSVSGVIKNALDGLNALSDDPAPYLDGKPVGIIITADGSQAAGSTLIALRSIIHALRAWPTPFGAALNPASNPFGGAGDTPFSKDAWQLETVATQVMEFVWMRAGSRTRIAADKRISAARTVGPRPDIGTSNLL
jgi:FMN reductase